MRLYLETTVPNFLFVNDSPDKRAETVAFWQWLRLGTEDVFISRLVEAEIERAEEPLRTKLYAAIADVDAQVLELAPEALGLAQTYVTRGVLPQRYVNDARHIALAVCSEMNVLVSWNLQHIVKMKTIRLANQINLEYGLPPILIHTPPEVMP